MKKAENKTYKPVAIVLERWEAEVLKDMFRDLAKETKNDKDIKQCHRKDWYSFYNNLYLNIRKVCK